MTVYNTLLLDQEVWDLVLDSNRNIAMAEPPYSVAQDVASALKLFKAELWFNTKKGMPYFEQILGKLPPQSFLIWHIEQAALSVPGVVKAKCFVDSFLDRQANALVEFIDENGVANNVYF